MRTITKKGLIDANRKAYLEHRLIAQNLDLIPRGSDPCIYVGPVTPDGKQTGCAIGVALTGDEQHDVMDRGHNVATSAADLEAYHYVVQFEDIKFATDLQAAHDNWATGHSKALPDSDEWVDPVEEYRKLIGL